MTEEKDRYRAPACSAPPSSHPFPQETPDKSRPNGQVHGIPTPACGQPLATSSGCASYMVTAPTGSSVEGVT
jgi:hypothetical protein